MSFMPENPEEFAKRVSDMLRQLQPDFAIDLLDSRHLLVNGQRLDLENLYRMANRDSGNGTEIVEHYLEQLFAGEDIQLGSMTLDFARTRIMPRIQPASIFEHLSREQVAHVPFVNDTVKVFVTDLPNMTISITTEQLMRWKLSIEELEEIARENLDQYVPEFEITIVESKEGGRAAVFGQHDGYDASRLLLSDLYNKLASQLRGDFFVAVPARDLLVAFSERPDPFIKRIRERVTCDYKRLPYPITPVFFEVTRDGIAGTIGPTVDKVTLDDIAFE